MKVPPMKITRQEITLDDLREHPVWYFDNESELFSPLQNLDEEIASVDELHFFAKFVTPGGRELFGSLAGQGDTAIGIFHNGRWYAANRGWRQTSLEQLSQLVKDSSDLGISDVKDLFPLKFETAIFREPYVDWSGVFDLS
jgi:hypothetical protein